MPHQGFGKQIAQQFQHAADDAARMARIKPSAVYVSSDPVGWSLPEPADHLAFADLGQEFGGRWGITRIAGGYRATPHNASPAPVTLYGRTPSELAESIRVAEVTL